jgi:hypothetical protein
MDFGSTRQRRGSVLLLYSTSNVIRQKSFFQLSPLSADSPQHRRRRTPHQSGHTFRAPIAASLALREGYIITDHVFARS